MSHNHDHDGYHHHAPEVNANNSKAIAIAALITGSFMGVELLGGIISSSLALIADAGHMLTDFAALVLAWFAFWLSAQKSAKPRRPWPLYAACINTISLFCIAFWILWEAWERFHSPTTVIGSIMFIIATAGLMVNIIVLKILTKADGENLNIRAANLHIMSDLLGSVAAIIAAITIIVTGWTPIDPILSVVVASLIMRGAWGVAKETIKELKI